MTILGMTIVGCGKVLPVNGTVGWVAKDGTYRSLEPFPSRNENGFWKCEDGSDGNIVQLCKECCIKFGFLW